MMKSVCLGETIPIRLFLSAYELTPTMYDIAKKFSVRYYLKLVVVDEEDRRYFKEEVLNLTSKQIFLKFCFIGEIQQLKKDSLISISFS